MRGIADVSPFQSSLFALKPRQVLLLEQQQQRNQAVPTSMAISKPEKPAKLNPEDDSILTFSVALWLENKGFSKVLKRFLPAAQIEDENWKAEALNLNEIFSQYQEIRNGAQEVLKSQKKQEKQVVNTTVKNGDANVATSMEIQSKKIKKKNKGDIVVNDTMNSNEDDSHKTLGPSHEDQSTKASKESNGVAELSEDLSIKKQKEKKKKKNKLTSQSLDADEKQVEVVPEVTESEHKVAAELLDGETTVDKKSKKRSYEAAEDGINESKKASKKRKRMVPNENENQPAQEVEVDESKSKKSKGLEEGKDALQQKGETFESDQVDLQEFSAKQSDESSKNAVTNGMDNSSQRKSANKQPKSSEPKTVNAFQRVKIDEVEFVDQRLQDNSYWAKDGAESGYGAKAQEVLGQVKGRGFRHEKTKKKRGSYRGGLIDLDSHSIKFNYSDEE